jgi:hypothetical protein
MPWDELPALDAVVKLLHLLHSSFTDGTIFLFTAEQTLKAFCHCKDTQACLSIKLMVEAHPANAVIGYP